MYKTCISHKCFQILELDLLHHHVPLDAHEDHGDERVKNGVDISHIFEFSVQF